MVAVKKVWQGIRSAPGCAEPSLARPSDGVALATQQGAPIYVSLEVWDRVEDVTEALRELQAEGAPRPEGDEPEGP